MLKVIDIIMVYIWIYLWLIE